MLCLLLLMNLEESARLVIEAESLLLTGLALRPVWMHLVPHALHTGC